MIITTEAMVAELPKEDEGSAGGGMPPGVHGRHGRYGRHDVNSHLIWTIKASSGNATWGFFVCGSYKHQYEPQTTLRLIDEPQNYLNIVNE